MHPRGLVVNRNSTPGPCAHTHMFASRNLYLKWRDSQFQHPRSCLLLTLLHLWSHLFWLLGPRLVCLHICLPFCLPLSPIKTKKTIISNHRRYILTSLLPSSCLSRPRVQATALVEQSPERLDEQVAPAVQLQRVSGHPVTCSVQQ